MATPLTLERCAEIRAEMEAGRLRDDVLARAGLSADEWTAAQRVWLDRMGAELKLQRFELTNRYTQAFRERQRELDAVATAVSAPLPVPAAPPIAPPVRETPGLPPMMPPPAMPRIESTPSPWAGEASRPAIAASPASSDPAADERPRTVPPEPATGMPQPSPFRQALPFQPAAAAPAAAISSAPARPAAPRAVNDLGGTVSGAMSPFASGAALPFAGGRPGAPPAPAPQPQGAAPPAGPKQSPSSPGFPSPVAAGPGGDDEQQTVVGTVATFAPGASALPFAAARRGQEGAPPPAGAAPAAAPAPPPQPAPAPQAAPAPAPASPGTAQQAQLVAGGLTLEQHASLCAELAHNPARSAETLARYRVSPQAKVDIDKHWQALFKQEPGVEAKWQAAYRIYFAFLSARRT